MNGAYTPGLMKKMTHPITKKYKNCALKKMEQDTKVVGNNRVDNVLAKNGDDKRPEGVVQEAFKAPVTTKQYPTITSADSTKIRGAYEYLLKPDSQRQKILDDSNSSATIDEADSYRVNQLRNFAKNYGLNAVKGVRNTKN